ncbi:hypothetical protein DPX16_19591 [Anabarilius grahami]|uniref:Uncharacterized protein n=1 Tax=Anabarilius grahami TaxID=495550 RepID=A0A3N0Z622_ANAGA|nr:hypothetical protein DPX16_19591 [Anabarilius grahami]
MDHFIAAELLCLEQKDCSLEAHLEDFLCLVPATTFPDNCLCSFLYAGLNTATKEQQSGEGPRGSFPEYVGWVLVSCGSPLTVDIVDNDDTSPTSFPVPSHKHPDCEDRQHEPTAHREKDFATMFEPAPTGATEQNITTEPEQRGTDQVCEPAAPSVAEGILVEYEGMESPATPVTQPSLSPISPSVSPPSSLSGVDPPRDCWEPPPPGREEPVAPPPASELSTPPRPVDLASTPMLFPPSSSAGTIGHSASLGSLGTSAPPGSALPQAPPPPSVAPAPPLPSGSLLPPRGVIAAALSRSPRPSGSLRVIVSPAAWWAPPSMSSSPLVIPMVASVTTSPWLLLPAPPPWGTVLAVAWMGLHLPLLKAPPWLTPPAAPPWTFVFQLLPVGRPPPEPTPARPP